MNKNKTYWLCQFAGWFGMVTIETINFTFFIVRHFDLETFLYFILYALVGVLSTHIYRVLLLRNNFFQKKLSRIWFSALWGSLLISTMLAFLNFVPGIINNHFIRPQDIRWIDVIGIILNWMRYVGVWIILYFMYKLLELNNTIQQEKMTLENIAKTTELELLKTQLNPHFLFNALNSIKALVTINPELSREAIVKLSELLRFTLQYGKEKVIPLSLEIDEVRKYLDLEKLRFADRLEVSYQIAPDSLNCTIPPAVLLTLAENAVKHGVGQQINKSIISIITSITPTELTIQLINSGEYVPKSTNGIGLKHIQKRLEEVYKQKASFNICNENKNVIATIKTPISWQ